MPTASKVNSTSKAGTTSKTISKSTVKSDNTIKVPEKKVFNKDDLVDVINGTDGSLFYESPREIGYKVEWNNFGDTQQMEYSELVNMRSSYPIFFEKNWVMFNDKNVMDALKVSKYYEDSDILKECKKIYAMRPNDIVNYISTLSAITKNQIKAEVKKSIESDELDSIKSIRAFEKAFNCKFI